jgi:glycosyltransferase involved in cell wall biosynthesis
MPVDDATFGRLESTATDMARVVASSPVRAHRESAGAGLRVAYLVNWYPRASHTFIRREIQALERQGVEVVRFAVRGGDEPLPDPADAQERGRTRYLLDGGVARLLGPVVQTFLTRPKRFLGALLLALRLARRSGRGLAYHLAYLAQACRLRRWLAEAGASHLHAHFGTNPAEVALLARALGGPPYSFTVHGPEEFDRPEALHLGEKMREAKFVVAISAYGRAQLTRWSSPGHVPRIEVVRCGVEPSDMSAEATLPPAARRLICVGRLCVEKGQTLLVEAMARLASAGCPAELVLAGDGDLRGPLEALIRDRGLESSVRITGWLSGAQVRQEIRNARALVLPSLAEGLPVVLMEALALQRPVISTYIAAIPELVVPGVSGWLVPAGDLEALVTAMATCLDADPAELASLGRAGRERVRQQHDADREASRLVRLFSVPDAPCRPG